MSVKCHVSWKCSRSLSNTNCTKHWIRSWPALSAWEKLWEFRPHSWLIRTTTNNVLSGVLKHIITLKRNINLLFAVYKQLESLILIICKIYQLCASYGIFIFYWRFLDCSTGFLVSTLCASLVVNEKSILILIVKSCKFKSFVQWGLKWSINRASIKLAFNGYYSWTPSC